MDKEKLQTVAFEIILSGGNGRSMIHEAFALMREGKLDEAEEKLKEAEKSIIDAHNSQTDLLQAYASGEELIMEIIMVHAQDHLMTTMTLKEVALEMLAMYRQFK